MKILKEERYCKHRMLSHNCNSLLEDFVFEYSHSDFHPLQPGLFSKTDKDGKTSTLKANVVFNPKIRLSNIHLRKKIKFS